MHVLPLELYPPATNLLDLLSSQPGFDVRAWTSRNARDLIAWSSSSVATRRLVHPGRAIPLPFRIPGYLGWHLRAAAEIARWKPDVLISVEPHSALATWAYYSIFRGNARLFIHHHEYYAPEDFHAPGMRLLRATMGLERDNLFRRAEWVSQTNATRLRLLREWNPEIRDSAAKVFPNYPPAAWAGDIDPSTRRRPGAKLRFVYVGAASFEDTFIREACLWVAEHRDSVSLHVCGNNVSESVWSWLDSLSASNITTNRNGVPYTELPGVLTNFDVGLVLYRGNTLNFVHNVPNKAIEYLACGLEVWYPRQMEAMRDFHTVNRAYRLKEVDYDHLPDRVPVGTPRRHSDFPFTAEAASAPLIAALNGTPRRKVR